MRFSASAGFFQELAKKLAERWVGLLLVPGALFVAGAFLGVCLGHAHALDWTMAVREVSATATTVARQPGGAQAVVIVVLLLAAAAVGLVVQAMTGVTRVVWLGRWPRPFTIMARWLARVSKLGAAVMPSEDRVGVSLIK